MIMTKLSRKSVFVLPDSMMIPNFELGCIFPLNISSVRLHPNIVSSHSDPFMAA
jgi:hypothetical protein